LALLVPGTVRLFILIKEESRCVCRVGGVALELAAGERDKPVRLDRDLARDGLSALTTGQGWVPGGA